MPVTCIQKIKKNNVITKYILVDMAGNDECIDSNTLRNRLITNTIEVDNLKLSSDNKIIDKIVDKNKRLLELEERLKNVITKASLLGTGAYRIKTDCGHYCWIRQTPGGYCWLYIPDDVTVLNKQFNIEISHIEDAIHIVGGRNVTNVAYAFERCKSVYIDLSNFDTSNLVVMEGMFHSCKSKYINLNDLDTLKVTNMNFLFDSYRADYLNLSAFDTSNVTTMYRMFYDCKSQELDFSNFNTQNVKNLAMMFYNYSCRILDLTSFKTPKLQAIAGMFMYSSIVNLKIDNISLDTAIDYNDIFYSSNILKISTKDTKIKQCFMPYSINSYR